MTIIEWACLLAFFVATMVAAAGAALFKRRRMREQSNRVFRSWDSTWFRENVEDLYRLKEKKP